MSKIVGIGNALTDVLVGIPDDAILKEMALPVGSMTLIDTAKYRRICAYMQEHDTHMAQGGSAANATRAIARLCGQTGFIGKVGHDQFGDFLRQCLQRQGTADMLLTSDTLPSGVTSTFILPEGERTFGTYLGAASALEANDLNIAMFQGYSHLFIEGYLVQNHPMIEQALSLAKAAGLTVAMDMASYNIVREDLPFFQHLVNDYVDIVFANQEEALAFTGMQPLEAVQSIARQCQIAVVKIGAEGSLVASGSEVVRVEACKAHCVDSTGAGDYYAGGFLYGLTNGCTLEQCARIGSVTGGAIVQVVGAELTDEQWTDVRARVAAIQNN